MSTFAERVRHTLGLRIALWYATVFALSALLLFTTAYLLLGRSLAARDRQLIESTLRRYAAAYGTEGFESLQGLVQGDREANRTEGLLVRIEGPRSRLILYSPAIGWEGFDLRLLDSAVEHGDAWASIPGPGAIALEIASARLFDGTIVQVGKSSRYRVEILQGFRALLFAAALGSIVIAVAGGLLVTRRALKPLNELIDSFHEIVQTGRLAARVPVRYTGDALDQLGALFNTMLTRIEDLLVAMRGSLDNVAHDLRTPLTRLRSVAEAAIEVRTEDPAFYREALSDCLEEADRVVTILTTLMDVSEAESGVMRLELKPVSVHALVTETIALYEDVADERRVVVSPDVPPDLLVTGDAPRLRRVFANLIDNALKYTPSGGRVHLRAVPEGAQVRIEISDTGQGIPPEDLPRIWDRLYRGDKSRTERGLGLGLTIVRAVVIAHRGRVDVTSELGRGSTFTVWLPAV